MRKLCKQVNDKRFERIISHDLYREEEVWRHVTVAIICILERRKKSMSYCFVSECNHVQESHTCQLFLYYFSAICAEPRFVQIYKIFTMVTWRNDFSSLLETYKLNRSVWLYASTMSRILSRENEQMIPSV